jgi:hypothetical protein
MRAPKQERIFNQPGDFDAMYAAEHWLKDRGFSVGPSQVDSPRAIWHGDCDISKWRNLSPKERRNVHALLDDPRGGPARILLMPDAPEEARAAFMLTDEEIAAQVSPPALNTDGGSNER